MVEVAGSGSGDQGSSLGLGWPLESGATARGSQDWLYFFSSSATINSRKKNQKDSPSTPPTEASLLSYLFSFLPQALRLHQLVDESP